MGPGPPDLLLLPVPVFLIGGWLLVSAAESRLLGNGLAVTIAERR
ncbi:MAG TPA: hypothetical protein VND96_18485 [Candidatus Micrarchaeaceae archaeon]|nr:hypothetical protein [Candidatus Micrarchaeaceae archaeon]